MQMRRRSGWLVALLIAAHAVMAWSVSPQVGMTADEPVHIVSGLYYWQTGDFRFQPENGNFPQRWVALPWVLAGVEVPAKSGAAWEHADIWALGHQLLDTAGPRRTALLAASRAMTVLLGCGLLLVIYAWSAGLWGRRGGLVSVAAAAFCSNLLAHAGLATSDTAGALGFLAAVLAGWRLCHRITLGRVAMAGLAAGFLAIAKFSAVLLPAVIAGLLVVRVVRPAPLPWSLPGLGAGRLRHRSGRIWALGGAWLAAILVAWVIVWSAYGFRFAAAPAGGTWMKNWDTILITQPQKVGLPQLCEPAEAHQVQLQAGALQQGLRWARDHRLLPEAWLYGMGFVAYHSHSRLAFFAGEHGTTGWWLYFPLAWWWKSTLAGILLLVVAVATVALGRERGRHAYRLAPLIALGAVYGGVSIAGNLNIGLRHELPLIAAGWVLTGAVATLGTTKFRRARRWAVEGAVVALLAAHAWASIAARPHYLAYFNLLAGPAEQHHRLLVDSNLDWGQGLPELATWLQENQQGRSVYLSYFGSDDPAFYPELSDVVRWGDLPFSRKPRALPTSLGPGLYVFGSTQFERVYSYVRGPWTAERERLYLDLNAWLPAQGARRPGATITGPTGRLLTPEEADLARADYDALTLGRVTHQLHRRKPLAVLAGGALLVFELQAADCPPTSGIK
ncbi:MAG: hypothetical protein H2172_15670 [Opitutus sp.]|nr:hypothetical protein [Opitutus sp.]MCS6246074.1 hypothetical protein [Opitutus sp.]MCS6273710.1 hypothetical protein [Opitutus sp.]MCS6301293.1 hypothetical protein [Opitutus sp.]